MSAGCSFYKTTIGKKVVVALTGIVLFGFVVLHMAGNLKTFMGYGSDGVHHLDHYAIFLREVGQEVVGYSTVLWLTRIVLLLSLLIHLVTVWKLRFLNMASRPVDYQRFNYRSSTSAARLMWWGGLVLLAFIVYHILHFTIGTAHSSFIEGSVYWNVWSAFQTPLTVGVYFVAMLFLGLHLFHGVWSLFQTLGLDNPQRNLALRKLAALMAVVVALGFVSVPIAVISGVLPMPTHLSPEEK